MVTKQVTSNGHDRPSYDESYEEDNHYQVVSSASLMTSYPNAMDVKEEDLFSPLESGSSIFVGHHVEGRHARVNGAGLWSSWQRNFKTPELAILDLFDNAVDATLHKGFRGVIDVYEDQPIEADCIAQGICIRNNCAKRIPDLKRVLEVFGSSKGQEQIGENGVGVKQACAALSDLSIVITKCARNISIGFLFKSLQMDEGCCIPCFDLRLDSLESDFDTNLSGSEEFRAAVQEYGGGDISIGRDRVIEHIHQLQNIDDEFVFLVILHRIIHRGIDGGVDGMLRNVRTIVPRNYLHIPHDFEVTVAGQRLIFQFWERRLAELHYFPIKIDPSHDYNTAEDWHMPNLGHLMKLYIGFDPVRAARENKNKATLCIYSRKSGRLVKEVEDARGLIGLGSGGTDYAQGLTIILDDDCGKLPLTPTKQDLAFGNEATGKVHEENLFAWIGAFAHVYYQHFLGKFGDSKAILGAEVLSHVPAVEALETSIIQETLRTGTFSTFHEMAFSRNKAKGKIRCCDRSRCVWKVGKDTRITFRKAGPSPRIKKNTTPVKSAPKKRKSLDDPMRKSTRKKREKVVYDSDSEDEFLMPTKKAEVSMIESLESELMQQKGNYDKMFNAKQLELKSKEMELFQIQNENRLLREATQSHGNVSDTALQEALSMLRRKCEALEKELESAKELQAENERLKKQVNAQKAYMVNLQSLNDSLRSLTNLEG
jgi:hypothetical protein